MPIGHSSQTTSALKCPWSGLNGGGGWAGCSAELVKKPENRHSSCNSASFWDKERSPVPMLSLELVENFLKPTPLTHREIERGDYSPSKVKLSYWQDRA